MLNDFEGAYQVEDVIGEGESFSGARSAPTLSCPERLHGLSTEVHEVGSPNGNTWTVSCPYFQEVGPTGNIGADGLPQRPHRRFDHSAPGPERVVVQPVLGAHNGARHEVLSRIIAPQKDGGNWRRMVT